MKRLIILSLAASLMAAPAFSQVAAGGVAPAAGAGAGAAGAGAIVTIGTLEIPAAAVVGAAALLVGVVAVAASGGSSPSTPTDTPR
jgi:hypothetical protein